ncbi:MAG: 6,7-dimethyl-8-ribityllumazine synthase [Pseudomonadota bacterium]
MASPPHFLIIEARFYEDIAGELVRGASEALAAEEIAWSRVAVPGALEIPAAIAYAADARRHCAFIALGCVIRGETSHYDIVAGESARALQDLAVSRKLAIGNGILTVENREQALARAQVKGKNKGGDAARAAVAMWRLKKQFGLA